MTIFIRISQGQEVPKLPGSWNICLTVNPWGGHKASVRIYDYKVQLQACAWLPQQGQASYFTQNNNEFAQTQWKGIRYVGGQNVGRIPIFPKYSNFPTYLSFPSYLETQSDFLHVGAFELL